MGLFGKKKKLTKDEHEELKKTETEGSTEKQKQEIFEKSMAQGVSFTINDSVKKDIQLEQTTNDESNAEITTSEGNTHDDAEQVGLRVADGSYFYLQVADSYYDDKGRGIARICLDSMDILGIESGDVLEIQAKRTTYAKCDALGSSDRGRPIIRIDELIRNNSGCKSHDTITMRKSKTYSASEIILKPLADQELPEMEHLTDYYLKDHLKGIPIVMGDNVVVPYHDKHVFFSVIDTTPRLLPLEITEDTIFHIVNFVDLRKIPEQNKFLNIAKERYAKGEITKEIFDQMIDHLKKF